MHSDVVCDVSNAGQLMRGEILDGVEGRRRWSDEQKLPIVRAVGVRGASITQVAQRHEVTRQLVYAWRHELKRKGLWYPEGHALFLPIDVPPAAEPEEVVPGPAPSPDFVEIILRNGRQLRVSGGIGDAAVARLIRLVEAA